MPDPIHIAQKVAPARLKVQAKQARNAVGLNDVRSQVVIVVDVSGSMDHFFSQGIVDGLVTRCAILGFEFDDDKQIPVYALNDGVQRLPVLTPENLDGYVNKNFRVGGGTNYAPSIRAVLEDAKPGDPLFVWFFTDGENYDHQESADLIKAASRFPIFWQFFGIYGRQAPNFNFLESLDTMSGRVIDNAGFSKLGLLEVTDEELFKAIMHEYKGYPELARRAGLLPWKQDNVFGRRESSGNSGNSGGSLGSRLRGWLS